MTSACVAGALGRGGRGDVCGGLGGALFDRCRRGRLCVSLYRRRRFFRGGAAAFAGSKLLEARHANGDASALQLLNNAVQTLAVFLSFGRGALRRLCVERGMATHVDRGGCCLPVV